MKEKIISYVKKYLTTFIVMGLATWAVLWLREFSGSDPADVRYLNLADSFTIPAVLAVMGGAMVWLTNMGTFDMLGYAFSRAKHSFIPTGNYKHERFYDYKVRKNEKRVKGYSFLFISGGIYFIPAIIFNILYYTLQK